jgi:hypothetical protein
VTKRSTSRSLGIAIACAVFLLVGWYVEAEDFSDSRVSGGYVFTHDGITQRLKLKRDHTFEQEDSVNGIVTRANGTWRVFSSTGHMAFSSSFIDARNAWRGQDEHEVFGVVKNYFGLVSITFESDSTQVKAYKKLFS